MIKVQQRKLWRPDDHPDGPQVGDCVRACVASVFEVDYEDATGGWTSQIGEWLRERFDGVGVSSRLLGGNSDREDIEAWRRWPTRHYQEGYWIAGIKSPRIPVTQNFGCGCTERIPGGDPECEWCHGEPDKRLMSSEWGLHAVVMQNGNVAWDPHPEAEDRSDDDPIYFYDALTFRVVDPAQLRRKPVRLTASDYAA